MIEQLKTKNNYHDIIVNSLSHCLTSTSLEQITYFKGKVRDRYDLGKTFALITTDRQSAFDRILATIPFKGQVLNQTGAWWFNQTKDIIPNHVIDFPDPNVTIAKKF